MGCDGNEATRRIGRRPPDHADADPQHLTISRLIPTLSNWVRPIRADLFGIDIAKPTQAGARCLTGNLWRRSSRQHEDGQAVHLRVLRVRWRRQVKLLVETGLRSRSWLRAEREPEQLERPPLVPVGCQGRNKIRPGLRHCQWLLEGSWISADTQECQDRQPWQTDWCQAGEGGLQPATAGGMSFVAWVIGVDQDVGIYQDHR